MAPTAKSPSFQFFYKDWRSSRRVQKMSFKERGMYLELLIEQWDSGPLVDDPRALADAIGAKDTDFIKCWPVLRRCFVLQADGRLLNEPLELIRLRQVERRQRRSDAGKVGAEARWQTDSNAIPVDKAMLPSPDSLAFASAVASAVAPASAVADAEPTARSKRPIFTGQRLTVHEWMLDDCTKTLGPYGPDFDLHEWFYQLDEQAVRTNLVIPKRDGGSWLQAQLVSEAQRRGFPLTMAMAKPANRGHDRSGVSGSTCPHVPTCRRTADCIARTLAEGKSQAAS